MDVIFDLIGLCFKVCFHLLLRFLFLITPLLWILFTIALSILFPGSVFGNLFSSRGDPAGKSYFIMVLPFCILFVLVVIHTLHIKFNRGKIILKTLALVILSALMYYPIIVVASIINIFMRGVGVVESVLFIAYMAALALVAALLAPTAAAVVFIIKR